jgi:nitrogenase iron protein NifH
MAERICFVGRGGCGKTMLAANLSYALTQMGYKVLLVGNDTSLSSTMLLRGEQEITPALEVYREEYQVDLQRVMLQTPSGVWCMELGSIDPGRGCMARGISLVDEMMEIQGIPEKLGLDYIFYDISGETPCTGYILPFRDGIMSRCILVTNGTFASVATTNAILQGILNTEKDAEIPIQLMVNQADLFQVRAQMTAYAAEVGIEVLAYLDRSPEVEYSCLDGRTIFDYAPDSAAAGQFREIARKLLIPALPETPRPFQRRELFLAWLRAWQKRELAQRREADLESIRS